MSGAEAGEQSSDALATEIMAYLAEQPTAVDTARGVREWWLRHVEPPPSAAQVEVALAWLAARGRIHRTVNLDRTILWSAADHTV